MLSRLLPLHLLRIVPKYFFSIFLSLRSPLSVFDSLFSCNFLLWTASIEPTATFCPAVCLAIVTLSIPICVAISNTHSRAGCCFPTRPAANHVIPAAWWAIVWVWIVWHAVHLLVSSKVIYVVKFNTKAPYALWETPVRSWDHASLGEGDLMPSEKFCLEAGIIRHWAKVSYALCKTPVRSRDHASLGEGTRLAVCQR